MTWFQRLLAVGRPAALACGLVVSAVGCGDAGAAKEDPEARAQTQAEAKNAMQTTSNAKSKGVTPQQSTRSAMEAGARQRRKN